MPFQGATRDMVERLVLRGTTALLPDGWSERGTSIAVANGRIESVGSEAEANLGLPGTTVVELEGRFAIPGLINSHTHLAIDHARRPGTPLIGTDVEVAVEAAVRGRRCLEAGITTLRDCNAPGQALFALRHAFASGALSGPRLFLSGQAVCASGGHMHYMSQEADGAEAVRRAARGQIGLGADFIKLIAEGSAADGALQGPRLQLTTEEMAAGVAAAHRMGLRATAHALSSPGVLESLAAGVDSIEHGYSLNDEALHAMQDRQAWLTPTLSVHHALTRDGKPAGIAAHRVAESQRTLDTAMRSVQQASAAGIPIACGSDGGSPLNPVWDLVTELELLASAGLTNREALMSATKTAAELLGVGEDLGTIAAGKRADIVVVDGNPESDLAALRRVQWVLKDGVISFALQGGTSSRATNRFEPEVMRAS